MADAVLTRLRVREAALDAATRVWVASEADEQLTSEQVVELTLERAERFEQWLLEGAQLEREPADPATTSPAPPDPGVPGTKGHPGTVVVNVSGPPAGVQARLEADRARAVAAANRRAMRRAASSRAYRRAMRR